MDFWTTVLTGAVSGVASGLVLAGLFWLGRKAYKRRERLDQIKYIATLIEHGWENMLSVEDSVGMLNALKQNVHGKDTELVTLDQLSQSCYKTFRFQLSSALSKRCTRLTYDEIQEVRKAFLQLHDLFPDSDFSASRVVHLSSFRDAESIEWLGLKPMKFD